MNVNTQYKIRASMNDKNYLRTNSYWYKYLNRNEKYYKNFLEELKEKYRLRPQDKLDKMNERLEAVSRLLDILN